MSLIHGKHCRTLTVTPTVTDYVMKTNRGDIMFFSKPVGQKLVDRGDPEAYDFTVGNFTGDNTWRDLDLSAIVPKGAISVRLYVSITGTGNNQAIYFRKKGNTGNINLNAVFIGVLAGLDIHTVDVFCNTDSVIQYNATTSLSVINVAVVAWVK